LSNGQTKIEKNLARPLLSSWCPVHNQALNRPLVGIIMNGNHAFEVTGFMKKLLTVLLLLSNMALSGCDSSTSFSGEVARLRVLHASPDAPAADVLFDSLLVLSGLNFGESSDYIKVDQGTRRIRVSEAGTTSSFIDVNYTLLDDKDYTFVIANYLSTIQAFLIEDDKGNPDFGKFSLRFLQVAPGAPFMDAYVSKQDQEIATLEPKVSKMRFGDVSEYFDYDEGKYRIEMTRFRQKTPLIDTGFLPFNAREIRTIVALDAPGGGPPYRAILLEDQ
jgi:hypothetical protein